MNDDDVIKMGFESVDEFFKLVSSVDLTKKLKEFKIWQKEDGSKEGLVYLLSEK